MILGSMEMAAISRKTAVLWQSFARDDVGVLGVLRAGPVAHSCGLGLSNEVTKGVPDVMRSGANETTVAWQVLGEFVRLCVGFLIFREFHDRAAVRLTEPTMVVCWN